MRKQEKSLHADKVMGIKIGEGLGLWNIEIVRRSLEGESSFSKHITIDPEIMDGLPTIKGTRIPVYLIMELFEGGYSIDEIIKEYPALNEKDIKAAIRFASILTSIH